MPRWCRTRIARTGSTPRWRAPTSKFGPRRGARRGQRVRRLPAAPPGLLPPPPRGPTPSRRPRRPPPAPPLPSPAPPLTPRSDPVVARVLTPDGHLMAVLDSTFIDESGPWAGRLGFDTSTLPAGSYDLEVAVHAAGQVTRAKSRFNVAWRRESWERDPREFLE